MPSPSSVAPSALKTAAGEPQTYEGIKSVVDRHDRAIRDGDASAVWDTLTSSGQAVITEADYATVVSACHAPWSAEKTISIAPNAAMTAATVTTQGAHGDTYTWQMVYEYGRWKHQPSDAAMEWMKLGAHAVDYLKRTGSC